MILKIGTANGYEYIQTVGNVKIESYAPMSLLNSIRDELEGDKEHAVFETHADMLQDLMQMKFNRWKEKNPELDDAMFDKVGSVIEEITKRISHTSITHIKWLETMIKEILKGCLNSTRIFAIEYEGLFDNKELKEQTLVMYNPDTSYLLNDEGKTIDIIR